jgi:hypothetical protein
MHSYRIVCRSVSEFFSWFRVLCRSARIHSNFLLIWCEFSHPFYSLLKFFSNSSLNLSRKLTLKFLLKFPLNLFSNPLWNPFQIPLISMSNLLHEFNSTSFESSLQIPYDSPSKTSMGISFSKFLFESTFILFCFSLISFEYLLTIYWNSLPKYQS